MQDTDMQEKHDLNTKLDIIFEEAHEENKHVQERLCAFLHKVHYQM